MVVVDSHPDDVFIIIVETSETLAVVEFSSILDTYSAHILHFDVIMGHGVVQALVALALA